MACASGELSSRTPGRRRCPISWTEAPHHKGRAALAFIAAEVPRLKSAVTSFARKALVLRRALSSSRRARSARAPRRRSSGPTLPAPANALPRQGSRTGAGPRALPRQSGGVASGSPRALLLGELGDATHRLPCSVVPKGLRTAAERTWLRETECRGAAAWLKRGVVALLAGAHGSIPLRLPRA
jgi:hypothetical protein